MISQQENNQKQHEHEIRKITNKKSNKDQNFTIKKHKPERNRKQEQRFA